MSRGIRLDGVPSGDDAVDMLELLENHPPAWLRALVERLVDREVARRSSQYHQQLQQQALDALGNPYHGDAHGDSAQYHTDDASGSYGFSGGTFA